MTVWETARSGGELVYRFRQCQAPAAPQPGPLGSTIPNRVARDADDPTHNGYCAALAAHWANLRMSDMDFVHDQQTARLDGIAHWRATKEQCLYRDGAGPNSLMTGYGFSCRQTYNHQCPPKGDTIAQTAFQHIGVLYISLKRDGGGHGMAVQSERRGSKQVYRYFDPNYGHFQFASRDRFATWLEDFFKNVSGYQGRYGRFIITVLDYDKQQRVEELYRRFG